MGARYCELWVRAKDPASAAALAAEQLRPARGAPWRPPAPGEWALLWQRDFDGDVYGRPGRRICGDDLTALGDAIYLSMYDGPAGELCGTFAYEHVVDGRVARKLMFSLGDDGRLRWLRVEGQPEAWETPLLSARVDAQLAQWRERRSDDELPPPTVAEEAAARAACLRFTEGEALPSLCEYELCGQVAKAFGLVRS